MKSSTIRRSALSKESMDVIENLANESPEDKENSNQESNSAPSEYQRENDSDSDNKSKEIDLLWQTFKSPQFNTNSTFAHVFCGFLLGVVTTVVILALFILFAVNSDNPSKYDISTLFNKNSQTEVQDNVGKADELANSTNTTVEEVEAPVVEQNAEEVSQNQDKAKEPKAKKSKNAKKETAESSNKIKVKKYIIKDGDTVEGIIKHNYGAYTQERAEAIMKVNHLKDLDHIGIDQELLLPVEK